eukprot:TRINITY_DN25408_c0_g1_i1.p1 TRINITY_DN25408_c0_g1~~TRINITY_DN25408_c0_g1_i1.p1  ORF type:complete len:580 (-),score=65.89 TRINITY_DN25408_c0_g1_i1:133-1872(-)
MEDAPSLVVGKVSSSEVQQMPSTSKAAAAEELPSADAALEDIEESFERCITSLPPSLVRAVDIRDALSGFGRHWASIDASDTDYHLSQEATKITTFVSHNWSSSRAEKCVALLAYSNGRAAVLSSLLTALMLPAVLMSSGVDYAGVTDNDIIAQETGCGGVAFAPRALSLQTIVSAAVVFLVVLLLGQRIRSLFLPACTVFLDKLCIHQTDEDKKALGILGLAAFMKASENIIVLWTPDYLTRLWCTYELAAWVRLGKDFKQTVHIVPVTVVFRLFLLVVVAGFLAILHFATLSYIKWVLFRHAITATWMLARSFVVVHVLRQYHGQVDDMARCLKVFSIDKSMCFCCSNAHVHPQHGQRIRCDRRLVLRTLATWLDDDSSSNTRSKGEWASENFNAYVQQNLLVVIGTLRGQLSSFGLAVAGSLDLIVIGVARAASQSAFILVSGRLSDEVARCGLWRLNFRYLCHCVHLMCIVRLLLLAASRRPLSPQVAFAKRPLGSSGVIALVGALLNGLSYQALARITPRLSPAAMAAYVAAALLSLLACFWAPVRPAEVATTSTCARNTQGEEDDDPSELASL